MQLNPAQQAAVDHRGSPLLVLAGAGTGKTRVITHRVAALMDEGVPPWRILAVTFTNKAAAEMRARMEKMCEGKVDVSQLWVGTFHSISARILRRHGESVGLSRNFAIYDTDDQTRLMKRVFKEMNRDDEQIKPRAILGHLDQLKNRGLTIDQVDQLGLEGFMTRLVALLGRRYQELLRAADASDFGDLLVLAVKLLEKAGTEQPRPGAQLVDVDPVVGLKRRFLHVVVDEYQDTNPVQARLVELLSQRAQLCVVGDDDQAIYGWRGADVSQILGFPDRQPGCELIRLEQNYRSTGHILHCADAIIRRNEGRLGKTLWSELGDGALVVLRACEDEREEARFVVNEILDALNEDIPPEEIAVFYRTHAQSRVIEQQLTDNGMRYAIFGGLGFFERKEIKDALAYLRLLQNPASDLDFTRIVNEPARGIGDTTVGRLTALAANRNVALLEVARNPEEAGVSGAAAKRLALFVAMIDELTARLHAGTPLGQLAAEVLERTGYRDALVQEGSEESEARVENLDEFVGALTEFAQDNPEQTLADYLEQVSLVSDADGGGRGEVRAVRLMTIHSAKGLEFEKVILTGMEEKVFPHSRSIAGEEAAREEGRRLRPEERAQLEEERRLAYVAVTRAKRQLVVTYARRRRLYNQEFIGTPSRFVRDLPPDSVRGRVPGVVRREAPAVPAQLQAMLSSPPPRPAAPARERSWNSDIVYDEGVAARPAARTRAPIASDDAPSLYKGMQVRHRQYGEGTLVGWDGTGSNLKLAINFPGVGVKTILARFCEPL
ncbi:ATP-dependent helicase [Nannocystis radixulma]|uniref:DNA 3'-5' helicase n=1 Tax=Nannocystis radixulma TaxID=2995305 RepID=A0ABT5BN97_9BACT|nr:UvrD-helicase domain-containing protein [Nannocystis radixulma]MDC0675641.1 exodeoxyribonuclease V subunit gamma [Nannocystis radixulma]